MKNNPELIQKYDDIITDQLNKGVIEKVGCESDSLIRHYIPHHAVVNPAKATTKVRVVYDASAKSKPENKSLNECLYRGPILLQNLTGILLRFRLNKIALVADIEKAFLQIGLQDEAKDVTRFFWLKDKDTLGVENNIEMYRFCRVPFGIISSPFLLAATIDHHLKNCNIDEGETIRENIYVDNVITGTQSIREAVHLYNVSKQIFKGAAMNLRDWMSNSQEVLNEIPLWDRANRENMKVLGLTWFVKEDLLALNSPIRDENTLTKRTVLRQIASIYDPLGLYSPVTLRGKLFLQDLWNQRIAWDKHLTEQDKIQWFDIHKDLKLLANCYFTRHIGLDERRTTRYQLLVFCDASKYAYAAFVYLLQEDQDQQRVYLIFSKTRLVPNKTITIPRLELLAALIGTRCMKFVEKELKVEIYQKHIWLDSQCVLNWIYSHKALGTFVENRIISDNAAQFKLASETINKVWRQILTEENIVSYSANENIQWVFTVELAPWMGGFYERLVGIVKRSLRKAIGRVCLNSEQLLTILKEAEAVINSRPLVYVGDDINSSMTLTPAHFLTLNPKIGLPITTADDTNDTDYNPEFSSADTLLVTWKKGLKLLSSFWKIWRDEYLLSLRERQQIELKQPRVQSSFTANMGDVVLIKDGLPRGSWRLGRIQELIKSRDGNIRSARVCLTTGKIIGRPLSILYPIECQGKETNMDSQKQDTNQTGAMRQNKSEVQTESEDSDTSGAMRPKRHAAKIARDKIRDQLRDY